METEADVSKDADKSCRVCDGFGWHWGWADARGGRPIQLRCPCVDSKRKSGVRTGEILREDWQPGIECEHGYDACPICDGTGKP